MLAIYKSVAFSTASGLALAPGATITVKRESDAGLAALFSDEAGTTPKANPFTADAVTGAFEFYVAGLARGYWVRSVFGAETVDARNQAVGTASQVDASTFGASLMNTPDAPGGRTLLDVPSNASTTSAVLARQSARQTALYGAVDANGAANFLQAGTGLRLKVLATAVALALSSANGLSDTVESFAADNNDILGADVPTSNTSYIYRTAGSAWGTTLVPPQDGYSFDRTQNSLLNFEGTNGSTTFIDDFGPTWTASGNAQISTAVAKFGTSSGLFDGTGDFITTTDIKSLGDGSWEMSAWFRIVALPTAGNRCTLISSNTGGFGVQMELFNNAGTTKLELALSSNGSSQDIAALVVGVNTTWTLNQQNKFRLVFDALGGTYRLYLSLNAAAETQDISVSSTARICALTQLRIGADSGGGAGWNGQIDAFRLVRCATKTATETPSAVAPTVSSFPVHWFSIPEMKMYEVTGASVVAGNPPLMTRRDRVFIGDADSTGGGFTTVRTYALRGEFYTEQDPLAGSTVYSLNDNIGTKRKSIESWLEAKTSAEGSWQPGWRMANFSDGNAGTGANLSGQTVDVKDRNVSRYYTHGGPIVASYASGSSLAGTSYAANWKGIIRVKRHY